MLPAVFQGLTNEILQDLLNRFVFVYLDDILIFSHALEEHIQQVLLVPQHLLENKLYVKPEKCEFHQPSVSFLGNTVARQLQPDLAKIRAVAEGSTPTSCKQLQYFLGFANFYQRFIRDYVK